MAAAENVSDTLLVAAIDFGTTFSGYAFAFKGDFKEDPLKISGFTWTIGGQAGLSLKTPTCVLFKPDQVFHSFGLEAEDKYTTLAEEDNHTDWYFFRRFKMQLYRNNEIPRDLMLEDEQGKHLPALKVFSESIKYLREHMWKELAKKDVFVIQPHEITWVLTVPAIWSDPAKQFMREAAMKGGIPSSQLMLALEPEAASIYCKHLPVERLASGGKTALAAFSPGTKYLILDAGGGTIDITVQEVQPDGSIKQLYMANGGDWGGTKVDQAFEQFLKELAGETTVYKFQDADKAGHLDLCREFEIKKRSITPDGTAKITFRVPITLNTIFEEEKGTDFRQTMTTRQVKWIGDKLRVDPDIARSFFDSPCQYITQHVERIFNESKVKGTDTILMVGGFSESPMLRRAVEDAFPGKTIIVPQESGLAVLKGAVQYGFEPRIISTRVCKLTYGVKTNKTFEEGVDPESKRRIVDGSVKCRDRFKKHVEIGQAVHINEATEEQVYSPLHSNQTSMRIAIYTSTEKNPRYTDDPSCNFLGDLIVDMSDTTRGKHRKVSVELTFGGTEIEVKAINQTSKEQFTAKLNFLR